jgi:hypothetical protein
LRKLFHMLWQGARGPHFSSGIPLVTPGVLG